MKTTDERLVWLGAGVMAYAVLQAAGLYYGLFFLLGLGLMLWGLLRLIRAPADRDEQDASSAETSAAPPSSNPS